MKKNYLLGLNMQTNLQNDNLLEIGKPYPGILIRTGEWDANFIEKAKCATDGKRNFLFFGGSCLNGTLRLEDDHVRLNFKEIPFGPDLNIDAFAFEVAMEVRKALYDAKGLVEEKAVTK